MTAQERFFACRAEEVPEGERVLCRLDGKSVGVFNVGGEFFALHNRCPHKGGALCEGPVTGTTVPSDDFDYVYGRAGRLIRCAWHGWEFELETGRSLVDPSIRAKTFGVVVEDGNVYVLI
ncbi:MAG: Rieske (2Fe-2S) protein [Thermoleophilia bacterium]|nr:Rieske (2Fe-2S) protein [Thermoleophilia bacterium]